WPVLCSARSSAATIQPGHRPVHRQPFFAIFSSSAALASYNGVRRVLLTRHERLPSHAAMDEILDHAVMNNPSSLPTATGPVKARLLAEQSEFEPSVPRQ